MKLLKIITTSFFCLSSFCGFAQKNDYHWFSGYGSEWGYDSLGGILYGITRLDFNNDPVTIGYDSLAMHFDRTNASFSDDNGNLLFYTNGIYIANSLNEKIEGSDTLNKGYYQAVWNDDGYLNQQGIIALNFDSLNYYYLLHTLLDTPPGHDPDVTAVLFTLLDMDENVGHGKVLAKNQTVVNGSFGIDVTAVKHANGRDWWVLVQVRETNCFKKILVDPNGVHLQPANHCTGETMVYGSISSSCFSPDGRKFIYLDGNRGLNIYDFDRCNGELSNSINIPLSIYVDSNWLGLGVSVSPNSRFVYVSALKYVYQYDLWATDIAGSKETVAVYDGYQSPFGSYFNTMQLAPNAKIYISCGNSETVYHVIDQPDNKGVNCNLIQHGAQLLTPSLGVPNYPNYRLGALQGSVCDTLTAVNDIAEKERKLRIFPNPATDLVTIDYGYTDWSKGEASLEVVNTIGQIVKNQALPIYSGFQKLDVTNYPSGSYTVLIKRNNVIVATGKLMKK